MTAAYGSAVLKRRVLTMSQCDRSHNDLNMTAINNRLCRPSMRLPRSMQMESLFHSHESSVRSVLQCMVVFYPLRHHRKLIRLMSALLILTLRDHWPGAALKTGKPSVRQLEFKLNHRSCFEGFALVLRRSVACHTDRRGIFATLLKGTCSLSSRG